MRKIYNKKNASCGFTLIETMAAMLILALVCVAYSQNQMGAIQLVKATRYRETATLLATQKMAEINYVVATKGIEQIKDTDQGQFDQEKFEGFTWQTIKKNVAAPDFNALMSQVGGTQGGSDTGGGDAQKPQGGLEGPMKMITDIWGKSIIELHLEINWKEGEQQKSYTLMTHYITSDATTQIQGLVGAAVGAAGAAGKTGTGTSSSSSTTSSSGTK